jgi:hypothetical protein
VNQRRRERRLAAVGVALGLIGAACVHKSDPGVGINRIQANLVFGVKPAEAQPGLIPIIAQPEAAPDVVEAGDLEVKVPPLPDLGLNTKAAGPCPEAPPTAAVEDPVDVNITGPPREGVYRWKHDGFATTAAGQRVPFAGFEKRVVRKYKKINATDFSFETVQPITGTAGAQFIVTAYEVHPAEPSQSITPPAGPVNPPTLGGPTRGLVLTKQDLLDSRGQIVSSFAPTPGLLLLPLPVNSSDTWQSVGVDPKSGATTVINGTVTRRQRIDACGDLVDGWLVDATQVSGSAQNATPDAGQIAYSYMVAPQFGGALVQERIHPVDTDPQVFDLNFTLAQLKPDPLPTS